MGVRHCLTIYLFVIRLERFLVVTTYEIYRKINVTLVRLDKRFHVFWQHDHVAKTLALPCERENCCCCYLIASWYVRKILKAFVNTKLILIKRLAKDEIQHEIS